MSGDNLDSSELTNMQGHPTDVAGVSAVVGIGASAGGLEALEELFRNMPADTGMAFVVVTHLHPGHKTLLPELLAKTTELSVEVASSGLDVKADHIYIGPPGGQLSIEGGKLQRLEKDADHAPKLPINYFLRSLAKDLGERAVCIILSGTGSDGTLGLQEIKAQAGMTMVEDPQSAKHDGMPNSAIATGLVDFVLPPDAMPEQLIRYVQAPYLSAPLTSSASPAIDSRALQEIFALLSRHTGHDFSTYKRNTIHRRIARRMNVHQIQSHAQYVRYLQENPNEIDTLFRELLINVTNFFRDPEAWEALAKLVDDLVKSRPEGSKLRVWVPGCSSGEEVYSIAILLHESMQANQRQLDVQIFGTDLDARAIDKARAGLYPEAMADDLTPERRQKYFSSERGGYRIRKDIRESTIFAVQNVIKDPPFTHVDLVSCRNLLIYLDARIQKKLLPIFHYALEPKGLLFLGSSETIGSFSDLFEPLDQRWKIFRRKHRAQERHGLPDFPLQAAAQESRPGTRAAAKQAVRDNTVPRRIERALLNRFAPASVIVNGRGDIVYVHGRTGAYLEPSEGQPRNNILEMAREGLQIELTEALRQASTESEVVRNSIHVNTNGTTTVVDLSVVKLSEPEGLRDLLLVSFRPSASKTVHATDAVTEGRPDAEGAKRLEQLERALKFMRETHRATLEELETANEELEATNEELQSTNEELQSTNEELETSKEEMQSLNEELTTVNAELQSKVEDLSESSNDMQNLLNSTKIATLFLDNELKIKRFTDRARDLVMLRNEDVGRPISDLASKLQHEDLSADCQNVLKTLVFRETEVNTSDGGVYLMRIMPYRTSTNAIDGLVLTFVDITRLKQVQTDLRHMSKVFRESGDPVIILNLDGAVLDLNDEAERTYGYSREGMLGTPLRKFIPAERCDEFDALLNRCRDGEIIRNVSWRLLNRWGEEMAVRLTLTVLTTESGEMDAIAFIGKRAVGDDPG
ncbi:chemotaxis protein CheB [Congregibacter variabilis]|uniref:protein-glutamate O-methyltransferase n=1 Tax=Congregibacter variabilis TaxID=3081200 RepID=A0ABZ0I1T2_9GAMM|nr:chemotaxis protein CheB [Congregibacter sp. IMCC43200]